MEDKNFVYECTPFPTFSDCLTLPTTIVFLILFPIFLKQYLDSPNITALIIVIIIASSYLTAILLFVWSSLTWNRKIIFTSSSISKIKFRDRITIMYKDISQIKETINLLSKYTGAFVVVSKDNKKIRFEANKEVEAILTIINEQYHFCDFL